MLSCMTLLNYIRSKNYILKEQRYLWGKVRIIIPILIFSALFVSCSDSPDAEDVKEFAKANNLYRKRELDAALKIFQELAEKKDLPSAYLMAGKVHYYQNNFSKALKYFKESLEKQECNLDSKYWIVRAMAKMEKNSFPKQKEILEEILTQDAYHLDARILLAGLYEKQGKLDKALFHYEAAMQQISKLAVVSLRLGRIYQKAQFPDKAKNYYQLAQILRPQDKSLKRIIELMSQKSN